MTGYWLDWSIPTHLRCLLVGSRIGEVESRSFMPFWEGEVTPPPLRRRGRCPTCTPPELGGHLVDSLVLAQNFAIVRPSSAEFLC